MCLQELLLVSKLQSKGSHRACRMKLTNFNAGVPKDTSKLQAKNVSKVDAEC